MHRIIVSDIFGKTRALEKIARSLSGTIEIFDPYDSSFMEFASEDDAYSYFSKEVGLAKYAEDLEFRIAKLKRPVSLLGFSVGGSAIWKISENIKLRNVSGALCFYSSQIRNYKDITPCFPIQLVFPRYESHFSVSGLARELSGKKRVIIHESLFMHGFMNYHSQNFNEKAYDKYLQVLSNLPSDSCIQTAVFGGV